ncbi:YlbE-like family protein [Virgibacillus byunsanensis]|uniref:YlbE-like family protein n=1 Tax=Virgibacillus byunsanensis TaxID=570945 RepID=A0ABW3LL61_9BACI
MQQSIHDYLITRPDLQRFVRYNPVWYRYLTRDPAMIYKMEKEAKKFYGKTFPQKLGKISDQVQMVSMLVQFAGAMKD